MEGKTNRKLATPFSIYNILLRPFSRLRMSTWKWQTHYRLTIDDLRSTFLMKRDKNPGGKIAANIFLLLTLASDSVCNLHCWLTRDLPICTCIRLHLLVLLSFTCAAYLVPVAVASQVSGFSYSISSQINTVWLQLWIIKISSIFWHLN